MRFLIFVTVIITVQGLLTLYISKRYVKKVHFSSKIKKVLNAFLVFNLFGVLLYTIFRSYPLIPNYLYFLLSIPIGLIFVLFMISIFYDISHFFINKTIKDEKRRTFFKKSLDLGSVALAAGISSKAIYNAKHYCVEDIDVKIKDLKQDYNIIQLSDVHIGGLIDQEFIRNLVTKVNSLKPDLVVITGDLVDTNLKYANSSLDELKNLRSKYGTFFIVGNHEYFHNIDAILQKIKSLNIKVLENESVYIGEENKGFNLAGVYDVFGYRYEEYIPDITKALLQTKDSPTVLLAHQPKFIEEVPSSVDLVLSGHTHGGQIEPFSLLVRLQQPYVRGLHQHNKDTQIYINKGTGFWGPPMRLGSSSEITKIKLLPS